jgi:hypothetical protein
MVKRWAMEWMTARVPTRAGNFPLHHRVHTGSGTHPASYPLSLGIWQPEREADHSPPSSAEVNNAWSYTSTPNTPSWCLVKPQGQLYLYLT